MKTFLVSRTDAIGDVVLTLPVCGQLKQLFPECHVVLLGRTYTQAVAEACPWVDAFLNYDELKQLAAKDQVEAVRAVQADVVLHIFPNKHIAQLAQQAGIALRIGTRNRWFHWLTCNRLISLSRKNSPLHEAQLNMSLLQPLGAPKEMTLSEVARLVQLLPTVPVPPSIQVPLATQQLGQLRVILHPRSRGSAREWGLPNFGELAKLLHQAGHYVFVTGTAAEGEELREWLQEYQPYIAADLTGKLSLPELLAFIATTDGLVAGSTGPLHLAAALGRYALGLYPPIRPMHPGRWAPLGPHAEYIVFDKPGCEDCRSESAACSCMKALSPVLAFTQIQGWQPLPSVAS